MRQLVGAHHSRPRHMQRQLFDEVRFLWSLEDGTSVLTECCRSPGAHIDLPWRNGQDNLSGDVADHDHLPFWCVGPGCRTGICIR